MFQTLIGKQVGACTTHFHDRLATLDSLQGCLILSHHDKREKPKLHKLVVREVRLWPEFRTSIIHENFSSKKAMLTLKVSGIAVKATTEDAKNVVICTDRDIALFNARGEAAPQAEEEGEKGLLGEPAATPVTNKGDCEAIPESPSSVGSDQQDPPSPAAATADTPRSPQAAIPTGTPHHPDERHGKKRHYILRCDSYATLVQLVKGFVAMQPPGTVNMGAMDNSHVGNALPHIVGSVRNIGLRLEGGLPAPAEAHGTTDGEAGDEPTASN